MTISSNVTKISISSGTSINITDLEAQSSTQIVVTNVDDDGVESLLVISTDYTINSSLTTITLVEAVEADNSVVVTLSVPNTQIVNFKNTNSFNLETVETALDKITLKLKEITEKVSRSIKSSLSSVSEVVFPSLEGNAGKYLRVGEDEESLSFATLVVADSIEVLNEDDLNSDSEEAVPTQSSVKTYVDTLEDTVDAQIDAVLETINIVESANRHYAIFEDRKNSGTVGGAAAAPGTQVRTLNTEVINNIAGCSLATNQITLPLGTYFIDIKTIAYATNDSKVFLYNVTDAVNDIVGMSVYANTTNGLTIVPASGIIIVNNLTSVFQVVQFTESNDGGTSSLGKPAAAGAGEVYTTVIIRKI